MSDHLIYELEIIAYYTLDMNGITSYRLRATLLPLGILAYVAVALGPRPVGSLETFPFFNWSLFSNISSVQTDKVVVIRSLGGVPMKQPTLFFDLKDKFATAASRDSRFGKTVDRLAYSITADNPRIEKDTRALIEEYYMREYKKINYDIAVLTYDPIARYKYGDIKEQKVLRSYIKK